MTIETEIRVMWPQGEGSRQASEAERNKQWIIP